MKGAVGIDRVKSKDNEFEKARKANATGKVHPFLNESEQLFKRLGPKHTHKHDKK